MLIKTLVTPSKHGFAVCVIFDVENDANGELSVKVVGPAASKYHLVTTGGDRKYHGRDSARFGTSRTTLPSLIDKE